MVSRLQTTLCALPQIKLWDSPASSNSLISEIKNRYCVLDFMRIWCFTNGSFKKFIHQFKTFNSCYNFLTKYITIQVKNRSALYIYHFYKLYPLKLTKKTLICLAGLIVRWTVIRLVIIMGDDLYLVMCIDTHSLRV